MIVFRVVEKIVGSLRKRNLIKLLHLSLPLISFPPRTQGSLSSVAFMNLNLAYNSVGFYQLSKLMCIPFTIFVQRVFSTQQEASMAIKLTLIPILLGVGLATVEEVALNWFGFVFALLAVIFTTFS